VRRDKRHAGLRHRPVRGQEDARDRRLHGFEMVGSLAHPLNIFILGLSGGFLIPLVNLLGKRWVSAAFFLALAAMAAISAVCLVQLYHGAEPIEITTGGSIPPYSIKLRLGLSEAFSATSVGLVW